MTAQTEARAVAPDRIWVTGSFHMGAYASGSWNVQKLSNSRTDLGELEYVRADLHAGVLTTKDAELAALKKQVEELTAERDEEAKCVDYAEKDFLKAIARAESAEAEAAALRKAWEALAAATVSSIRENDNPNRVIFKDGFTIEGRAADEWLKFMRLIQRMARAALNQRGADLPV